MAYVVLFALWAVAVLHSFNEYRKHRDEEQRVISEAEAATRSGDRLATAAGG